MLLKPEIEAGVDAVRCSAAQVRKSLDDAKAIKDASMRINEQDEWVRYKTAKRFWQKAEQLEQGAIAAYEKTSSRFQALPEAINKHGDPRTAFAVRVAERAYREANNDINDIAQLVEEAKQNCLDACGDLFRQ